MPKPSPVTRLAQYIQPGHVHVARTPTQLTTILGSCVSVCLWDAGEGIGGMNHFMLPQATGGSVKSPRFGNFAMQDLFDKVQMAGARRAHLQARVFGGACMFEQMRSSAHLGQKNIELALDFLSHRGIDVVETNVGGDHGRKLRFFTDTGDACLTLI